MTHSDLPTSGPKPTDVLDFWFQELKPKDHWRKDVKLDQLIEERFGPLWQRAAQGELFTWRSTAKGRLAEIIVLDQFSRNIHRDTPLAFAADPLALALAQEMVAQKMDESLKSDQRKFAYMPFMHSESPLIHQEALRLFDQPGLQENLEFELKHKAIIDRFGRYPHRNKILGRDSTKEELDFLTQPGSSF